MGDDPCPDLHVPPEIRIDTRRQGDNGNSCEYSYQPDRSRGGQPNRKGGTFRTCFRLDQAFNRAHATAPRGSRRDSWCLDGMTIEAKIAAATAVVAKAGHWIGTPKGGARLRYGASHTKGHRTAIRAVN